MVSYWNSFVLKPYQCVFNVMFWGFFNGRNQEKSSSSVSVSQLLHSFCQGVVFLMLQKCSSHAQRSLRVFFFLEPQDECSGLSLCFVCHRSQCILPRVSSLCLSLSTTVMWSTLLVLDTQTQRAKSNLSTTMVMTPWTPWRFVTLIYRLW